LPTTEAINRTRASGFPDAVSCYPWLKTGHSLLAIVAVGFNFTYRILIRRAAGEPEHFGHVLRTVKYLDDRFATPAYLLLPVLGLAMVFVGGWDITTLWILASLGLYVTLVFVGAALYSPTLRRQIAALDANGAASSEFRELTSRGNAIGALLGLIVVVIVGLMVLKPTV
jgi:uncharacterized membrane protein